MAPSRITLALEAALVPLLAGVLTASVGVHRAFWADGLTSLVSALLALAARGGRKGRSRGWSSCRR